MKQARRNGGKTDKKQPRKLRILIANADQSTRNGVRHLLDSQGWEICGEATDGVEAVEKTKTLKPDVVIMDIAMPRLNVLDATHQILEYSPLQKILVLTADDSTKVIRDCRRAGVQGFFSKSDSAAGLSLAVRALAVNKTFFTTKTGATAKKIAAKAS
jgi:NarL family two-component system response regulator LiaR